MVDDADIAFFSSISPALTLLFFMWPEGLLGLLSGGLAFSGDGSNLADFSTKTID